MNESDDYKKGWYDGYQAGKAVKQPPPFVSNTPIGPGTMEQKLVCNKCGLIANGIMPLPCPRSDCTIDNFRFTDYLEWERTMIGVNTDAIQAR